MRRVKELVSTQSSQKGAQERVCKLVLHSHDTFLRAIIENCDQRLGQTAVYTNANAMFDVQDQEAKDPPIPLPQRHRPKVSKKPQTRSPRHDEGVEGGQGGEEVYCVTWDLCLLVKAKMTIGTLWALKKNHTDDQVIQALRFLRALEMTSFSISSKSPDPHTYQER